ALAARALAPDGLWAGTRPGGAGHDCDGRVHGLAALHVTGTDSGRAGSVGSSHGYLLARDDALRSVDIAAAIPGGATGPGHCANSPQGTEAASGTGPEDPAGSRDDLSKGD